MLTGVKRLFCRIEFCTCARSVSNERGATTGVRPVEKKRWFCPPLGIVEEAAGRPLALRLCRVGTTGRLPFTKCAFCIIWLLARWIGACPWPKRFAGTVEMALRKRGSFTACRRFEYIVPPCRGAMPPLLMLLMLLMLVMFVMLVTLYCERYGPHQG